MQTTFLLMLLAGYYACSAEECVGPRYLFMFDYDVKNSPPFNGVEKCYEKTDCYLKIRTLFDYYVGLKNPNIDYANERRCLEQSNEEVNALKIHNKVVTMGNKFVNEMLSLAIIIVIAFGVITVFL